MKLDNTRLLVSNFDDCLHFYQEILGLKLTWGERGGNYANFDAGGGKVLGIFKKELMAEAAGTADLPNNRSTQDNFALIFEVDNLEKTVKKMKERGGYMETAIQNRPLWGIRTAHIRDPDDNLIELITKMDEKEWDESLKKEHQKYES
ncbi:VOC family protein [Virgibacillus kimchii]